MDDSFRIFASIATAIVLEAMPFIAFGSLLSALVEVLVSADRIARAVPRSLAGRIAVGIGAGVILPTCECGVVPVARRLISKGAPASTAIAYLLAAPIVNPVVLASTYVAFRGDWAMMGARAFVAAIVAGCAGFLVRNLSTSEVIRDSNKAPQHGHDHDHAHDHDHDHAHGSRFFAVWRHAGLDFLEMGKFLIFGACAAAAMKTFLPPESFGLLEGSRLAAVSGMMVFAAALSICSEADAFVAASFVTLPAAAHLAFIAFGPMVDIKLIGLFAATFRRRVFWILILVPTLLVFVLSLLLGGLL